MGQTWLNHPSEPCSPPALEWWIQAPLILAAGSWLHPAAEKASGIARQASETPIGRDRTGGVKAGGEADARRAVALRPLGIPADH